MLEKNILCCLNSTLRLCPKRFNCSTACVQKNNNEATYTPNGLSQCKISPVQYLNSKPILSMVKERIPQEYLTMKNSVDSLYVTDPSVARMIVTKILPYLKNNTERVVAECTPGLGLITRNLLQNDIGPIKLFEPCSLFREQLKKLVLQYSQRVQLYSKNLFKLSAYNYVDQLDNGNRVEKLLKNVPKKGWTEGPAISIIGPLVNKLFLFHIMVSLSYQTSLFSHGRVEMFLIMKPHEYLMLSTEQDFYKTNYNYMIILFNTYFDYKLLHKLPRKGFLPWEKSAAGRKLKLRRIDTDKLYLVHMVAKRDLPLSFEELLPFYLFLRKFFNKKGRVIPIMECCVPDCGVHIMIPQLEHEEYFKHLNIFTVFEELTPKQILGVFREMYKHPNYVSSPFSEIVNGEIIKMETIEPNSMPGQENNFIDFHADEEIDLEENFSEKNLNNI